MPKNSFADSTELPLSELCIVQAMSVEYPYDVYTVSVECLSTERPFSFFESDHCE